ncbi:MAG: tetratricopeptide repeat protein [Nitrospirae bacterium]|nr:MAG: tetratricopeptide repeat protein [Nitrospirota bacterium]
MASIAESLTIALQHHQAGRLPEAEALYRQILQAQPQHPDALHLLGVIAHQRGQHEAAVDLIGKALTLSPQRADFHNNIGQAYRALGRFDDALSSYGRALALQPVFPEAYYNLGNALSDLGRIQEAATCFWQALALKPDYTEAHNNLGVVLGHDCKFQEAEASFRRALAIKPDSSEACNNLAGTFKDQGKIHEAMEWYKQALAINPGNATAHSNLLLAMSYDPAVDSKTMAREHRRWNERHVRALSSQRPRFANRRDPERQLRVGYVSADFHSHPIGHWMVPLLAHHNRAGFEIYAYSAGVKVDQVTCCLQASTDVWRRIAGMSDEAVADMIRADRIDILVDLSGHTAGTRLLVFARKPVPVQVTYLGSWSTTGLSTMDYKLTDRFLTPPRGSEWFSEKLVRLPGGFVCYQPPHNAPPVTPPPSSATGRVTFGSFNNVAKLTLPVVALWAEILCGVPEAILLLKDRTLVDPRQQDRCRGLFEARGVEARRLELLPATPFPDHLKEYGRIDIALDPFPYNGCYTSCEALWMGVPVITLAGCMTYGRYGVSLLSTLGYSQLIADTPKAYLKIAVGLAKKCKDLAALRAELRPRMAASALCDAKAFAQGVEQAYRSMWRRWCGK